MFVDSDLCLCVLVCVCMLLHTLLGKKVSLIFYIVFTCKFSVELMTFVLETGFLLPVAGYADSKLSY